jgi:DNA-binding LacI/PurR family transcriptional regulator
MREAGLGEGKVIECGFQYSDGGNFMRRLSVEGELPSAILFGNDSSAFGAIAAARGLGVNVPGRVSVAGFDGLAGYMDYANYLPDLTTMIMPAERMGATAAELLLKKLAGSECESVFSTMRLHKGATVSRPCE